MKLTVSMAMSILLLAVVVGCAERAPAPPADPAAAVVIDRASDDVPPATAPAAATAALRANGAIVADGAISFAGFGAARFGATVQAVREAWGHDLDATPADEPGGCHYLLPQSRPERSGYGVGFMFEGGRFVRVDVDSTDIVAPGGGRIGMSAAEIGGLYQGPIDRQPHKYVDGGRYLRITDPAGGDSVLVFETDADGRVAGWRVGVPPQVDYVEGCS